MRTIEIDDEGAAAMDRLLDSGQCKSESEAVALSLRLLEAQLTAFQREVAIGMNDCLEGRFSHRTVQDIIADARARYEKLRAR